VTLPFEMVPLPAVVTHAGLTVREAVALALEVCRSLERQSRSEAVLVPRAADLWIASGGRVGWRGGRRVAAAEAARAAAELLRELLDACRRAPRDGAPPSVPAALRYAVVRAADPLCPAPARTLGAFIALVERFAPPNRAAAIDALLARFRIARSGLPPLGPGTSISDIRRRRRAGGVSLRVIANDTGIPLSLLRELEWGLFTNWGRGAPAEAAIRAYADRAGLEVEAVLAIVKPHLERPARGAAAADVARPQVGGALDGAASGVARDVPPALPAIATALGSSPPHPRGPGRLPSARLAAATLMLAAGALLWRLGAFGAEAIATRRAPIFDVSRHDIELPDIRGTSGSSRHPSARGSSGRVAPRLAPAAARAGSDADDAGGYIEGAEPEIAAAPAAAPERRVRANGHTGRRDEEHPLVRLGRLLAGDGRHRVQPFPRPSGSS
jgi:hypothetical protein